LTRKKIAHGDRMDAIRATLLRLAREGRTIFYGELGQAVGIPARGPWKPVLDEIARLETAEGRPDITFLVINKQTGLPGQIGFKPAKPPTPGQRRIADAEIQKVYGYYRAKNDA
jgi:hypothetical protein